MKRVLRPLAFGILTASVAAFAIAAENETLISGRVTQEDGSAVANATVSIPELNLTAVTDRGGRYTLTVPAEAVRGQSAELRVVAPGLRSKTVKVTLSTGALTHDFVLAFSFQQEVTVGSRAMGTAAEKAVPVDVFTEEQIATAKGTTETNQIIQALDPSFNFPRPTITDGTDSVRPATLRNLGPDQMLVLINGKRRHTSALVNVNNSVGRGSTGVDLNAIPASAIEKIEILRDGAAAQYGSDAIAGVINVVLKSGASPPTLSARGGATTHGDGGLIDASGSSGFHLGRGSVSLFADYRKRDATNRARDDLRDQIVPGDGGNNAVPQPNHHWGDSKERNIMALANASIPINEGETSFLYAFGGWSRRDGSHGGFYRRGLDNRNQPAIYPLGFLPLIEPKIVDYSGTAGARGVASNLFWDLSAQYGHNRFDFNLTNTLNTSLGPRIPPNQTNFYSGSLEFNHFLSNLDLTREFNVGLAGALNVAAGLEFRRENYQVIAGEPASYIDGGFPDQFGRKAPAGAQVFPGFRPSNEVNAYRNSYAAYLDLEGNVLASLRLGLAGRFEHYSDFGNTKDFKFTVRFQPIQTLVLRGATSTGFRAPSLGQSFFSATSTNFLIVGGVLTPFEVGTFPVSSPVARALGAQDLRPEDSVHYSAGLVWDPSSALSFTADYFRIAIDHRIVFSGNFTGPRIAPLIAPFGVNGARFFTNAIDTRTKGFDLTANYKIDLAKAGTVRLSSAYSRAETTIVGTVATPPQLAGLAEVLFDRVERRRFECSQPKDNLRFAGNWRKKELGGLVRLSRYGEFCSFTANPADDQTYSTKWLTDLELSYDLGKYTIAIGAENLFEGQAVPHEAAG